MEPRAGSPVNGGTMRSPRLWISLALLLLVAPSLAVADDEAPDPALADPVVAVVVGDRVNLRAGPRQDDAPVMQLADGAVLLIVERAGEWLGVRLPSGFTGAIHAPLTVPVDADHVRVEADDVNLR